MCALATPTDTVVFLLYSPVIVFLWNISAIKYFLGAFTLLQNSTCQVDVWKENVISSVKTPSLHHEAMSNYRKNLRVLYAGNHSMQNQSSAPRGVLYSFQGKILDELYCIPSLCINHIHSEDFMHTLHVQLEPEIAGKENSILNSHFSVSYFYSDYGLTQL